MRILARGICRSSGASVYFPAHHYKYAAPLALEKSAQNCVAARCHGF